jgi:small subunit ribosomal protein S16
MVKIRLRRIGKTKGAFYRIVVADSRRSRNGRFIEEIGTYDPYKNNDKFQMDIEKAKDWLNKGARPTDTVRFMLETLGLVEKCKKTA